MSDAGPPPRSLPVAGIVAVAAAFVVGVIGTAVVVYQLGGGRTDTTDLVIVGIGMVGGLCAVVGAACRSRREALVAGAIGFALAVAVVSGWWAWPIWLVWLWVLLGIPFLAGFGFALLLTIAFLGALERGLGYAAFVAAVIVVTAGAGIASAGPRLIEGPCIGTSIEQGAASYLGLVSWSDSTSVSLDAQLDGAGQDPAQLKAAYDNAAVHDEDFDTFVKGLCFPATVRPQVAALRAAVEAREQVHRLLAGDPFDSDLLAQHSSAQRTVSVAMAEVRRGLGLPPLAEPSAAPSG